MLDLNKDNNSNISLEKTPQYDPANALPGGEGKKFSKGCLAAMIAAVVVLIAAIITAVVLIVKGGAAAFRFFREVEEEQNKPETVATPNGEEELADGALEEFYSTMYKKDAEAMSSVLDKYPYLIYYIKDGGTPLLDDVSCENDTAIIQAMLDHGAKFDDEFTHRNYYTKYSLKKYLEYHADKTVTVRNLGNANDVVSLMLNNGAAVEFENDNDFAESYDENSIARKPGQPNALFDAAVLICRDETLDENDAALMKMLIDAGADKTEENYEGKTALENFEETVQWYELDSADEYYTQIADMLK